MSKLAVFPASGKLGTSIYTHLLKLVDPKSLVLISRNPSKISKEHTDAGVTTRQADYDTPGTLEHAFDDVSHLILISYPSIQFEHRFKAHKAAITAARNSAPGVSHVFCTSLAFGGDGNPLSVAHVMQAHLATEKYLASLAYPQTQGATQKPFSYTAIREGIYSEAFPMYTGFFSFDDPSSQIKIPHDGSGPGVAWAKMDELGEATAQLAHAYRSNDADTVSRYENKTIVFSGSKEWSLAEVVVLLGKIVGKELSIKQVSVEEYVLEKVVQEKLQPHGPDDVPGEWATSFEAIREGETATVTDELERLLGRPPEDLEATLRCMASS